MHILIFILAILLFISLILIHEWGHYFIARRNGVEVEEFGLGFPPRAFGKKLKSGMILSLNWLPLGGFVKLKGEHDSHTSPGSFGAASLGAKTRILLGGVAMNLIAGLVLLTILALIGMPVLLNKSLNGVDQYTVKSDTKVIATKVIVSYIEPDSAATKTVRALSDDFTSITNPKDPIRPNDRLISIRDIAATSVTGKGEVLINNSQDLINFTRQHTGAVKIIVQRNNQKISLFTNLQYKYYGVNDPRNRSYLGLVPQNLQIRRSTWSAPIVALGFAKQLVVLTLQGLGHALGGLGSTIAGLVTANHAAREKGQTEASSQVGGPVAIMKSLYNSGNLGFNFMLALIAIISLTLALINVLPIPALDGGRLVMILVSRGLLKRPLSPEAEARIVGAGMVIILALIVLITIVDVKRFF